MVFSSLSLSATTMPLNHHPSTLYSHSSPTTNWCFFADCSPPSRRFFFGVGRRQALTGVALLSRLLEALHRLIDACAVTASASARRIRATADSCAKGSPRVTPRVAVPQTQVHGPVWQVHPISQSRLTYSFHTDYMEENDCDLDACICGLAGCQ